MRDLWTEEGARSVFADLVTHCVRSVYPTAQGVRPDPGDEGLDTFVGDFDGDLRVYQAKYFCDALGDSQKSQVRSSWKTCRDGDRFTDVVSWTLCVPIELSAAEHAWWQKWSRKESEKSGCDMQLWSRSHFSSFYGKADLKPVFEIALKRHGDFESPEAVRQELRRREDVRLVEALPTPDHHANALFVKKLEAAGWSKHRSQRTAFYNFELLRSAVELGGTPQELAALRDLRERVFNLWETAYNEHSPDGLGVPFVAEVERRIHAAHKAFLRSSLPAGEMHKVGAIHDWADHCFAGWTRDFESLQDENQSL